MMDPFGISMLSQIPKLGVGIWQMIKAGKIDTTRPDMPIPAEVQQSLGLARTDAGRTNMLGYDTAMANVDRTLGTTQNSALRVATGSGQALEALVGANAGAMAQKANIDIASQQDAEMRRGVLRQELANMANWKHNKWAWDQQEKYRENSAAKSAMIGAGMQNVFGAIDNAGQTLMMKGLYGGENGGGGNGSDKTAAALMFGGGGNAAANSAMWDGGSSSGIAAKYNDDKWLEMLSQLLAQN